MLAIRALSLGLGLLIASVASASHYSSVVVYGDSLSDNGNLYAMTGGTIPGPPYYAGRRSDGPVAVEYLAATLGAPLVDYAVIGATTGIGNFGDGGTVTTTGGYSLPGVTTMYGATSGGLTPYLDTGLFVVWAGANDWLAPSPLDSTPQAVITRAVANQLAIIDSLMTAGAKSILVPGMVDLGLTPEVMSQGPAAAAAATAFTDAFNLALIQALPPSAMFFDTAGLMRAVVMDPMAYGLSNVSAPCYDKVTVCADPDQYLFFDSFHPSTVAHAIVAENFAKAVPEPSTWLLLGAGWLVWRRRAA